MKIKDIKGYEGLYAITSDGRVFSYPKLNGNIVHKSKWLVSKIDKYGYLVVNLSNKKVVKTKKIHRLVADAFIERPNDKNQVNHKDGNKENNRVVNLEWCSGSENVQHAFDTKLRTSLRGEEIGTSILTTFQVRQIRSSNKIQRELGKQFGVSRATIGLIRNKKLWKHV